MPDFNGTRKIWLRPNANSVPISWVFAAASNAATNDGSLPYGTTISSATVTIFDADRNNRTANVVNANSTQVTGGNTVACTLKHPNTGANNATMISLTEPETYTAVVTLTLNTATVIPYECRRIVVDPHAG